MKPYSDELVNFIEEHRMKLNIKELCQEISDKFDKNISEKAMRKYFYRHNLDYKKKIVSKFDTASNSKPIGTESLPDKNGLVRIKVSKSSWQYKQRYIYEQYYGKIPKGYVIMFLDGDNTNFDISNLACVENKNKLYIQSRGLISHNKKMTETGLMISELYYKTKSVKKND